MYCFINDIMKIVHLLTYINLRQTHIPQYQRINVISTFPRSCKVAKNNISHFTFSFEVFVTFIFPMPPEGLVNLIFLLLVTQIISAQEYKSWSSSFNSLIVLSFKAQYYLLKKKWLNTLQYKFLYHNFNYYPNNNRLKTQMINAFSA